MLRILRRLDLTEEQHEQVRTILEDNKESAQTAEKAVQDARKALHQTVIDQQGEEAIRNAAAEIGTAIGNQAVLKTQTIAAVKGVLTEEQKQKLETMKEKALELRENMQQFQDEFGPGYNRGPRGRGMQGSGPGFRGPGKGRGGYGPPPPPIHPQW
jgi:Spy/CpxP family protein refolding chaperone